MFWLRRWLRDIQPWKVTWNRKHHPIEKENPLPNFHDFGFQPLIFRGVNLQKTLDISIQWPFLLQPCIRWLQQLLLPWLWHPVRHGPRVVNGDRWKAKLQVTRWLQVWWDSEGLVTWAGDFWWKGGSGGYIPGYVDRKSNGWPIPGTQKPTSF